MPRLRHVLSRLPACLLAFGAVQALAAGIGEGAPSAVLGQPLDFVVQLRTDPGEVLAAECVQAEVTVGDRRLPPAAARAVLERGSGDAARVRVQTTLAIDEPVIGVLLQVGCSNRVSRRFVLLADPPATPGAPAVAAVPLVQPGTGAPATGAQPPPALPAAAAPTARRTPRPAEHGGERTGDRTDAAPRLRLDILEPSPSPNQAIEQALQAVAEAASATRAARAAQQDAEQRIASLETTVAQLRGEARQARAESGELRERLRRSEGAGLWLWPLVAGLVVLGALSAWLARELSLLRKAREHTWQQGLEQAQAEQMQTGQMQADPVQTARAVEFAAAGRTPTSPIPFVNSEIVPPPAGLARSSLPPGRAWPPPAPAEPARETLGPDTQPPVADAPAVAALSAQERAVHRTLPLPTLGQADDAGSPRDVSIEELIDLEQQAEFFVVLGQDEAAVDLLVEHLRSTGGGSPLPYLKLLEIHHRRGDKAAYERTRQRFNQRFNAYAPPWEVGLQHGRPLEDYPGVIPRLQQVWQRPLDAMAELEALLFRKSRGDLFDLPAYRDVLLLYSLARDLLDREAASSGDVDLLLPLADGGNFGSTTPHPYLGLERDSVFDSSLSADAPTSPVDLDLSGEHGPGRIFDPLDAGASSDKP